MLVVIEAPTISSFSYVYWELPTIRGPNIDLQNGRTLIARTLKKWPLRLKTDQNPHMIWSWGAQNFEISVLRA